jgi:hypothetical protein
LERNGRSIRRRLGELIMASTIKALYGTNNQSITCTITSLANNGQQSSAAIDNTTNLFLDALVNVKVKSNSASTSSTGYVNVYAYGTADGGTTYGGGETGMGTNASVTLTVPPNIRLIGVVNVVANSTTYNSGPLSVAAAFGGVLPDHWGIVIENKSGAALDASIGSSFYQGVQAQTV